MKEIGTLAPLFIVEEKKILYPIGVKVYLSFCKGSDKRYKGGTKLWHFNGDVSILSIIEGSSWIG